MLLPADIKAKIISLIHSGDRLYLGNYTKPDGTTSPSIHISPPDRPREWNPSGLECIIQRTPKRSSSVEQWSLYLIQRDGIETIDYATKRLVDNLPKAQAFPIGESGQILAQVAVTFNQYVST
jgi:hypothetical protein